jgi:hypothetical protein
MLMFLVHPTITPEEMTGLQQPSRPVPSRPVHYTARLSVSTPLHSPTLFL